MFATATIEGWLNQYQTNGVNLGVAELLQYRHHTNAMDLTPKRPPQARLAGTYVTRLKGRGMEFDESRHYQPGDDIRAIDWRVTARTGKTHTKVFREERERPVYICTDLSDSMQFGSRFIFKSVQAAHLTALIAWSAMSRGDKVGGVSFTTQAHRENKPRSRQASVLSHLNGLVALQNRTDHQIGLPLSEGKNPFLDNCSRISRLAKPGSLVWIISDFKQLDNASAAVIADMQRHCEVRACVITDPLEMALPKINQREALNVTDGVSTQTLVLGDVHTNKQYEQWAQNRLFHLTNLLEKAKIAAFSLSAGQPILQQKIRRLDSRQLEGALQ